MTTGNLDDDEAARWAIRLDSGPLDAGEQSALDNWLLADERRHGSLLRAEAALAYLDRGRALAEPMEVPPVPAPLGRRAFLVGGAVTGLTLAGALGYLMAWPVQIQTALGEVRRVPLADGSIASLNTSSKVVVAMRDKRREVKLEDGEAWFQVAHDKARPFVVKAGDVRIQAVGTAFSVRRRGGGADVLVTEGAVDAWVVGRESERTRIRAGSKSFVAEAEPLIVVAASEDIDRALAWRTGEIALNGESLEYAASELNRYNSRKIVVDDRALGSEPIVGYFRADRPEDFARAVAGVLGCSIIADKDTIRLSRSAS